MDNSPFGAIIYLLIGYVCGVLFSGGVVTANILHTDWYNIWTYAWILAWPFMLVFKFIWPLFVAALKS